MIALYICNICVSTEISWHGNTQIAERLNWQYQISKDDQSADWKPSRNGRNAFLMGYTEVQWLILAEVLADLSSWLRCRGSQLSFWHTWRLQILQSWYRTLDVTKRSRVWRATRAHGSVHWIVSLNESADLSCSLDCRTSLPPSHICFLFHLFHLYSVVTNWELSKGVKNPVIC